jgi:hypothetical protein
VVLVAPTQNPDSSGGSHVPLTGYPATGIVILLAGLFGGGILARLGLIGVARLRHARSPAGGGPGGDGA